MADALFHRPEGRPHDGERDRSDPSGRRGAIPDKVAAYERDQDVQLTPTITLAAYLRWWLDIDLVEQAEDGLITATTRLSYVNPIIGHVIEQLGSVRLRDLPGARIRERQT